MSSRAVSSPITFAIGRQSTDPASPVKGGLAVFRGKGLGFKKTRLRTTAGLRQGGASLTNQESPCQNKVTEGGETHPVRIPGKQLSAQASSCLAGNLPRRVSLSPGTIMKKQASTHSGPAKGTKRPAKRASLAESLAFIARFATEGTKVGALFPSSRALAEMMLEGIEFKDGDIIVEYGPGTGAFTELILERLPKGARYLGIERDPHFHGPVSYTHLTLPTNREV